MPDIIPFRAPLNWHYMAIHRCLDCNSTIKDSEKRCWACGSEIKPRDTAPKLSARFASAINFFFILSLVVTAASMFTDLMPPFLRCATVSGVLFLVRSSAGEMAQKKRKS
ncbi:MAG TPA: hypothetical protein VKX39_04845 [Bryobacteraceae bacterium]|jgi:DNA-directed RNA polymerase subunit RPC12/RpoP|nr:hypothetical protein [Bryobacteraceae bacterium]